jgi:5'-nucleotidase
MTLRSLVLALIALVVACGAPEPSAKIPPTGSSSTAPSASSSSAAPVATSACLSIVAWNDMHGQLTPDVVHIDTGNVPAGGVIAVADELAAVRATGDVVVVLDAGDLFTGPLASTMAEGAPIMDAYAVMGVDAAAIGNHEFDFGPVGYARVTAPAGVGDEAGADGPRGALFARMASAHFPFLSANLHRDGGKPLEWAGARASVRIARGGFDVGVVGYTTIDTPTTTLVPNVVGLDFATDRAASVAAELRALRAAGASPVVLLAHASLEGELPQLIDDPADPHGDKRVGEMASLLDAIPLADRPDVVVAGHRHAWMLGRVRGVPIVSSDQHGVGLARLRYCRANANARPTLERIERRVAMASDPPASPLGVAVATAVAPWIAKVQAEADAQIATLHRTCWQHAPNGTALGEQVARALVESVTDAATPLKGVPVVGIMNTGGQRAPLRAGKVTYADLFTASPFENAVAVCATTRAGVARVVANALKRPAARERFPVGIAGAKLVVTRAPDATLTLRTLDVPGAPKDGDAVWLVIPDFILWGGDGMLDGVTCTKTATSSTRVREAWRKVLAREQTCDGPPKNVIVK